MDIPQGLRPVISVVLLVVFWIWETAAPLSPRCTLADGFVTVRPAMVVADVICTGKTSGAGDPTDGSVAGTLGAVTLAMLVAEEAAPARGTVVVGGRGTDR